MTQRPFRVPRPQIPPRRLRLRHRVTRRQIPQTDHALHQPHPRRQLLDTLPAPVLWALDPHHLFARFEHHLDRPAAGECRHHPRQARPQIRREQVRITELPLRVAHHHDLDRRNPSTSGHTAWCAKTRSIRVTP